MGAGLIDELFHPGDRAAFVVAYDALRSCCLYEKHLGGVFWVCEGWL